jgi:hypothetical protein
VCALGTRLYDERVGLALTALFCTQPMSMALRSREVYGSPRTAATARHSTAT